MLSHFLVWQCLCFKEMGLKYFLPDVSLPMTAVVHVWCKTLGILKPAIW